MSSNSKHGTGKTVLATIGILLIPAACCGAPLLLGAGIVSAGGVIGVVGVVGSILGNPWIIAAAIILAAGFIGWWMVRRYRTSGAAGRVALRDGWLRGRCRYVRGRR